MSGVISSPHQFALTITTSLLIFCLLLLYERRPPCSIASIKQLLPIDRTHILSLGYWDNNPVSNETPLLYPTSTKIIVSLNLTLWTSIFKILKHSNLNSPLDGCCDQHTMFYSCPYSFLWSIHPSSSSLRMSRHALRYFHFRPSFLLNIQKPIDLFLLGGRRARVCVCGSTESPPLCLAYRLSFAI